MTDQELQLLKYPIGKFNCPDVITNTHIAQWISVLENFPERLEHLVKNLTDEQLNTPYRPGGWTIRQTIHHLSDSHHHSYARFKWTLTEKNPVIKAYHEDKWAELFDAKSAPISMSLIHLKAIHTKLVYLLKGLTETDFDNYFIHPESQSKVSLKRNVGVYAWHSNHHYTHIENTLKRNNWI